MGRGTPSPETLEKRAVLTRERAERNREIRAGRLVVDDWAIWPTENGYWILADNDAETDSVDSYRYYPDLAGTLHKLLDYALSKAARRDVLKAYQAIVDAEKRITARAEEWVANRDHRE